MIDSKDLKKRVRYILGMALLAFVISLAVELFVFNVRFFQSALYDPIPVEGVYAMTLENAHVLDNGYIELDEGADAFSLTVKNINRNINNIRLDIDIVDEDVSPFVEDHVSNVAVAVWDDALHERMGDNEKTYLESGMYDLTEKKIASGVAASEYIWLETFGEVKAVKLTVSSLSGVGRVFRINNLTFNAARELDISLIRLMAVFFFVSVCYIFLFEKQIWRADCVTPAKWKVILPVVLIGIAAIISFAWAGANPLVTQPVHNEYAPLARAFLQGETSVGNASELVKSTEGKIVFWNLYSDEVMFDYAYYDGKYYVYFGALPCVVFFVPYYLLTGRDLPNYIPVISLCMIMLTEIYLFLGMIIRRYYRQTPYAARLLMTAAACGGMYIPFFISVPDHYMIAIAFGVDLSLAGVMCWMKAFHSHNGDQFEEKSQIRIGYLTLGSVCMAAVSLCRPTLLIIGLVLIVVLLIKEKKEIMGMRGMGLIRLIFAIAIPYAIFALICMCYNYVRFDSPFDFGASKNMTTIPFNGSKGYFPYLIARSVYEYLLAPAVFTADYPFFTYQGWRQITDGSSILAVTKPDIGLFTGTPVLWLGGVCIGYRKKIKEKGLLLPLFAMLICAFVLMIFATVFTFCITDRYTMEFSIIFFMIAFIGIMELYDDFKEKVDEKLFTAVFFVITLLLLAAFFYGGLQIIPEKGLYNLSGGNTGLYYRIYYAMNFML